MEPVVNIQKSASYILVQIEDSRLSAANAAALKAQIAPHLTDSDTLLLDLSNIRFIDSSGLGLLVGLKRSLAPSQRCALIGMHQPGLLELMQVTRMDQIFLITDNLQSACRRLGLD
ncbi:MAG: STAS domain-containing protein [Pontibacterium sp.]